MDPCIPYAPFKPQLKVGPHLEGEGLLRISDSIRSTTRNGLDPSVCTYSYQSFSRGEFITISSEKVEEHRTAFSACKKHRRIALNATWRGGNTVLLA